MPLSRPLTLALIALLLSLGLSCCQSPTPPNQLSQDESRDGWVLLFDGKSLDGWHVYNMGKVPSVWSISGGEISCDPSAKNVEFGDLVTDNVYRNYQLRFEWKITKGGNSGVFINVQEDTANATAWTTGPEYQLLDNDNATDHNKGDMKRQAGCVFGLSELKNNAQPLPYGQWNQAMIEQMNGKIVFWLNGKISAEEDLNSNNWKERVALSSLGKFPRFGKATSGKVALQNWAKGVSFRNIRIREISL